MLHRNIEGRIFSIFQPCDVNKQKINKDKRVITDFRHLNVRIAKTIWCIPWLEIYLSVLGSSKCEVLSVLDLKHACYSLRLSENSNKYCGILPYFDSTFYLYQRMPMRLNISPSILAILYKCDSRLSSKQEIL